MQKILVPFDFSLQSTSAFSYALDIVQKSKGEIHLLHVIELPVIHDSLLMPVLTFEEQFMQDLKKNASKNFTKIINKHGSENKNIKTQIEFGSIHQLIIDYIEQHKIDMVIMGTKGSGGLRELLVGSNTEKIVRKSSVPVIAVKKYIPNDSVKDIVFPNTLDTEGQEDLILKVKELQNFFDAKLHIVWINTPLLFKSDTETQQRLTAFAKRFMFKNYTLNIFNHQNEEQGILHFTNMIKGDLIALGTHGRTGMAHILSGSLAEDLVNEVSYPVWTYMLKAKE
jgi:nucleotide-binding universal stress UspA family protein